LIEAILKDWPEDPDAPLADITPKTIAAFSLRIERFSVSRWNGIVGILKTVVPAAKELRRRRIRVKDRLLLSPSNYHKLLDALDARPRSHAGLVVRFLAQTGFRINEARQIRWAHVFEDHIFAPGEITKSGRPRRVPFVSGTIETLTRLKVVTGNKDCVLPQAACPRTLRTACGEIGIETLSHHDFRHLFATRCIQSGVDLPTVARWLGHQDGGALLARVYFHLVDEHSRRMAALVKI
jgi:integrase